MTAESTVHYIATEQSCRLAVDHAVEQTATPVDPDELGMKLHFSGSSPMATSVTVDLDTPPPQPRQAIQQIQQHDQQQVQMMGQLHAQNAHLNQQGSMLGGR